MKHSIKNGCPTIIPGIELSEKVFHNIISYTNARIADSNVPFLKGKFGLLMSPKGKKGLKLSLSETNLTVIHCYVISPTANLIWINEPFIIKENLNKLDINKKYRLTVNGALSPSIQYGKTVGDLPNRKKFSRPDYIFCFTDVTIAKQRQDNEDSIDLAELVYNGKKWKISNYYPPCCQIGAITDLNTSKQSFVNDLDILINLFATTAYQAIWEQSRTEKYLRLLCIEAGSTLSRFQNEYHSLTKYNTPDELFKPWLALAGNMKFIIQMIEKDNTRVSDLIRKTTKDSLAEKYNSLSVLSTLIDDLSYQSFSKKELRDKVKTVKKLIKDLTLLFRQLKNYSHTDEESLQSENTVLNNKDDDSDGSF